MVEQISIVAARARGPRHSRGVRELAGGGGALLMRARVWPWERRAASAGERRPRRPGRARWKPLLHYRRNRRRNEGVRSSSSTAPSRRRAGRKTVAAASPAQLGALIIECIREALQGQQAEDVFLVFRHSHFPAQDVAAEKRKFSISLSVTLVRRTEEAGQ